MKEAAIHPCDFTGCSDEGSVEVLTLRSSARMLCALHLECLRHFQRVNGLPSLSAAASRCKALKHPKTK